ncbi:MAG: periplasmic heavy metal sensor [Kiritimatiellae bacterium]|nr:periplasmic heavy metal sensor [Kiritimatiellia bacterium]
MKKTAQTIPCMFLLSAIMLMPVFAGDQGEVARPAGNDDERRDAAMARLELSAGQKEKIDALRQSQRGQMQALMQALREKNRQIRDKLNDPAVTRETIAPLAAEIKEIHSKMVDLRINNIFAIKEILNAEQIRKLQEFKRQRNGPEGACRPFWGGKKRGNRENDIKED